MFRVRKFDNTAQTPDPYLYPTTTPSLPSSPPSLHTYTTYLHTSPFPPGVTQVALTFFLRSPEPRMSTHSSSGSSVFPSTLTSSTFSTFTSCGCSISGIFNFPVMTGSMLIILSFHLYLFSISTSKNSTVSYNTNGELNKGFSDVIPCVIHKT